MKILNEKRNKKYIMDNKINLNTLTWTMETATVENFIFYIVNSIDVSELMG